MQKEQGAIWTLFGEECDEKYTLLFFFLHKMCSLDQFVIVGACCLPC